jgi:TolB protein
MTRSCCIAIFAFFLCLQLGCRTSTSPSSGGGSASGTLVFEESDEVVTASLGSNATVTRFQGQDPAWTSDGRIVFDLWGMFTTDHLEHLNIANLDGTNAQTIVNMQESNSDIYAHPKLSPDGKYLSFNYSDFLNSKLGTHFGTLIYGSDGTPLYYIDSLWDASWGPDGSLVVAGTVNDPSVLSGPHVTFSEEGLFLIDKNIATITPIGTGLTQPMLPSVSPDGKRVAFEMNSHIWTINIDGTGLKQITTGANTESYSAWSPDGNSIACETSGALGIDGGTFIAIVSSNPSTPVTVSQENSSVYVKDNAALTGFPIPTGALDWR